MVSIELISGRCARRLLLTVVAALIVVQPREAAAQQGFVHLLVGRTVTASGGGDADGSRRGFGIAFGSLGHIVSAETEFAYFPDMFDAPPVTASYVVSVSGNILIGPTIGPAKVYGAVGFGDLYVNAASSSASFSTNYLTLNGGAGMIFFLVPHVAVRGDLRYYRATGVITSDLAGVGITLDRLAFWRPTVGLTLAF